LENKNTLDWLVVLFVFSDGQVWFQETGRNDAGSHTGTTE